MYSYSVVEDTESDDVYLMAGSAVNKFMELSHRKLNTLFQLEGITLKWSAIWVRKRLGSKMMPVWLLKDP